VKTFTENEEFTYKGKTVQIPVEFSLCGNCNKEYIVKQQILKNEAVVRDAKKAIDGLLTSTEIKLARETLGLTQAQASQVFGGGRNAFSKYERAEVAQSVAMDKLIKLCLDFPEVFERLLVDEGIVMDTKNKSFKKAMV
jgi:HTH-type transcriptional regulator/antitoxin MqsA